MKVERAQLGPPDPGLWMSMAVDLGCSRHRPALTDALHPLAVENIGK